MYDTFSSDYDRFVSWPGRLDFELPLIQRVLAGITPAEDGSLTVLDAACGTGMHAVELARRGYTVAGADISPGMIERARENAAQAGVAVDFYTAGFGQLHDSLLVTAGKLPFSALLCLGNSLPHVADRDALQAALDDFGACLRQGGVLLIQQRNFDQLMSNRERWMEPQAHREGDREWLFIRFYDYRPDGSIDFNILNLMRERQDNWRQQVLTTTLYPVMQADLTESLASAGFSRVDWLGSLAGEPFDPPASGNLVVLAYK